MSLTINTTQIDRKHSLQSLTSNLNKKNCNSCDTFGTNPIKNSKNTDTFTKQKPVQKSIKKDNNKDAQVKELERKLNNATKNNGFIGSAFNKLKSWTKLGVSSDSCKKAITDFKFGKITYKQANEKIESYISGQKNAVNVSTSLATGLAVTAIVASAVATGGLSLAVVGAAAGAGAVIKTGLKLADRATNKVKNDEFNVKQIGKDATSGVLDGVVSAVTLGMGTGAVSVKAVAEQSLKQIVKKGVINGAKSGAVAGGIMGAGDYSIEAIFEKDADFKVSEFITSTLSGAAGGAVLGSVMGGFGSKVQYKKQMKVLEYRKNHFEELSDVTIGELSEQSSRLSKSYTKNNEVEAQLKAVFDADKMSTIEKTSARVKSEKSIFAKLARKYIKGDIHYSDNAGCFKAVGDAYGTRIQLKSLTEEQANAVISKALNGTSFTREQLINAMKGKPTGLNEASENSLKYVASEVLDELKEMQTKEVVQGLVNGIKSGKISITEYNNYGNDLSSYFTDKQLKQIANAYFEKTGKELTIVTKQKEIANISKIYTNPVEESTTGNLSHGVFKEKGAVKDSGYATSQMNVEYTFSDGTKGYGELQIRGSKLNTWGDAEHVPYDIRQNKITEMDTKYLSIYNPLKEMAEDSYMAYQKYSADIYDWYRLEELGIKTPEPQLDFVLKDKNGNIIPKDIVKKLTREGLINFHNM